MSKKINPGDVIGKRIKAVFLESESDVQGMDFAAMCVHLENDVIFALPASDETEIRATNLPSTAKKIRRRDLRGIRSAKIVNVYRQVEHDGERYPIPILLELDSGNWITCSAAAPHGTGATGLVVVESVQLDTGRLEPFGP